MLDNHTSQSNVHVPLVLDCSSRLLGKAPGATFHALQLGSRTKKRLPLCVIIHYKEIIMFITTAAQSLDSDEVRRYQTLCGLQHPAAVQSLHLCSLAGLSNFHAIRRKTDFWHL